MARDIWIVRHCGVKLWPTAVKRFAVCSPGARPMLPLPLLSPVSISHPLTLLLPLLCFPPAHLPLMFLRLSPPLHPPLPSSPSPPDHTPSSLGLPPLGAASSSGRSWAEAADETDASRYPSCARPSTLPRSLLLLPGPWPRHLPCHWQQPRRSLPSLGASQRSA